MLSEYQLQMVEYNFSLGKDIKRIPYICSKKKYKLCHFNL